jgi:type VI secretion system Hcp family effector
VKKLATLILAIGSLTLCTDGAIAQTVTGFMKVPNIPGESKVKGYENQIAVFSVTEKFDGAAKNVNPCSIDVTKGLDKAGPLLFIAAVTGQNLGQVQIDIVSLGDTIRTLYRLVLSDTHVVAITSTPEQLTENLTVQGDSITLTYFPVDTSGAALPPVSGTANCK